MASTITNTNAPFSTIHLAILTRAFQNGNDHTIRATESAILAQLMESDKGAKKIAGIGSAGVEDVGKRVVDEEVNRIEQGKNGGTEERKIVLARGLLTGGCVVS